jgi:hypothetical protein
VAAFWTAAGGRDPPGQLDTLPVQRILRFIASTARAASVPTRDADMSRRGNGAEVAAAGGGRAGDFRAVVFYSASPIPPPLLFSSQAHSHTHRTHESTHARTHARTHAHKHIRTENSVSRVAVPNNSLCPPACRPACPPVRLSILPSVSFCPCLIPSYHSLCRTSLEWALRVKGHLEWIFTE